MKVRLTIDLELPESYREFTDPELRIEYATKISNKRKKQVAKSRFLK